MKNNFFIKFKDQNNILLKIIILIVYLVKCWHSIIWNLISLILEGKGKDFKDSMIGQECIDSLWWINQLISEVN